MPSRCDDNNGAALRDSDRVPPTGSPRSNRATLARARRSIAAARLPPARDPRRGLEFCNRIPRQSCRASNDRSDSLDFLPTSENPPPIYVPPRLPTVITLHLTIALYNVR